MQSMGVCSIILVGYFVSHDGSFLSFMTVVCTVIII